MREIIFASNNKGKIEEVQKILKNYKIISLKDAGLELDIEEDQNTSEGNAIKKAETLAKVLNGKLCIGDDSGIEIEYLDGFPGVFTKRWKAGSDRERNLEIIKKLQGVPRKLRKIKFVSAIAVSNGKKTICESGELNGYVSENIRGENGFGFDEIFELENGKTLAEISKKEKNDISARKTALSKIEEKLSNNII